MTTELHQRLAHNGLSLRNMHEVDLLVAVEKTRKVGWPHQLHDWQFHFQMGQGFVICDEQQNVVGTILWWEYGPHLCTLGLVVVDENYQGKGLGRTLMDCTIEQVGNRTIQLVATLAGTRLYEQCGFVATGQIFQVQGKVDKNNLLPRNDPDLKLINHNILSDLIAYDSDAFGGSRDSLVNALFEKGQGFYIKRDNVLCGYGFIRKSGKGQSIGPLIANNEDEAKLLAEALIGLATDFVRFDLTDNATELPDWLTSIGLVQVDNVIQMQKGENPRPYGSKKVFSLVSQAFG